MHAKFLSRNGAHINVRELIKTDNNDFETMFKWITAYAKKWGGLMRAFPNVMWTCADINFLWKQFVLSLWVWTGSEHTIYHHNFFEDRKRLENWIIHLPSTRSKSYPSSDNQLLCYIMSQRMLPFFSSSRRCQEMWIAIFVRFLLYHSKISILSRYMKKWCPILSDQ